jgi:uroporphyrinogen decarboxylase
MQAPWNVIPGPAFKPCFDNLLAVLRRERPARPVLYEIFLNPDIYAAASEGLYREGDRRAMAAGCARAFSNLGYDHCYLMGLYDFRFPRGESHCLNTISLNEGGLIRDWATFEAYPWPDPDRADILPDDVLLSVLPAGMRIVPLGPGGVLENAIGITGYETLCLIVADDPALAQAIFDGVGSRLLRLYERLLPYRSVGAIVANDDWGFKTQPMLSPAQLRTYVFPWHKRIAATAHAAGKPVILHSCGNPCEIMDDIVDGIGCDGRHSYEDGIVPVEEAYDRWGERIAILGGLDVDFLTRASPEAVKQRARAMLDRSAARGGYALGSGNSIPGYVPVENYLAMLSAAWERY